MVIFVVKRVVLLKCNNQMNSDFVKPREEYNPPFIRITELELETAFLQSNLEPIDGGDDPDIDW